MRRLMTWIGLSLVAVCLTTILVVRSTTAQEPAFPSGQPPALTTQQPGQPPGPPPGFQPQPQPGGPPPGGFQPSPGGPGFGPGRFQPISIGPTQMAVGGDSVYILRGNRIYRLDAKTLKVQATGELPQENRAPTPLPEGGQP